jgi:hypothetical protein
MSRWVLSEDKYNNNETISIVYSSMKVREVSVNNNKHKRHGMLRKGRQRVCVL